MAEEYKKNFCTRCGAPIPEGSTFCPKCGVPVEGGVNPYAAQNPQYNAGNNTLGATSTLLILYAIMALVLAVLFLAVGVTINEEMWAENFEQDFGPYNPIVKTLYLLFGVCLLVSSGMAFMSYRYTKSLTHWKNATTCCLAATISIAPLMLGLVGFIMIVIGILVTYRIHRNKSSFIS